MKLRRSRSPWIVAVALGAIVACSDRAEETAPAPAAAPAAPAPSAAAPPPSAPAPTPAPDEPLPPELTDGTPLAVFEGTLPCPDCDGVRTELTLLLEPDRYVLAETFVGGSSDGRTARTEGSWTTVEGTPDDPDATVIRLDSDDPAKVRNFVEAGGEQLELLDAESRRVPANAGRGLSRRGAPAALAP